MLMTGMVTPAAGFDKECWTGQENDWSQSPGTDSDPRVAAIVNWFGIADVPDELHGANAKGYAVVWVGDQPNGEEIAKRVSPINYVNKNNPRSSPSTATKTSSFPISSPCACTKRSMRRG